jgi:hypothetical protein
MTAFGGNAVEYPSIERHQITESEDAATMRNEMVRGENAENRPNKIGLIAGTEMVQALAVTLNKLFLASK